jgi:aminoglycoside 6-adenylyltransferase
VDSIERLHALPGEAEVLAKLIAWGTAEPDIRAMILTSTRARPERPVDLLSDYDLILAVQDVERFSRNDVWQLAYGTPMVSWGDQGEHYGLVTHFRGVVYADYVKIDYSIWPVALLRRVAAEATLLDQLDVGYSVLLDKNGHTAAWQPPSYRAHIPSRPSESEYLALIEEFWWSTTYVAKSLWRGELVFSRWCLDQDIKLNTLRRMLEWRIETDHHWSLKPGIYGRGLERWLPPDIWSDFAGTYVGLDLENSWAALFRTNALFRRVAREAGATLGYTYPQALDDQVSAYLEAVRYLLPALS